MLLLAGCAPHVAVPPMAASVAVDPSSPVSPAALALVTSLAGEWRVAGIDGKEIGGSEGIALRADAGEIWWEPRCAGFIRSYTIDGRRFSTRAPVGSMPPRAGDPPPLVCQIAPPPQMPAIFQALSDGTTVERTPNNGVLISGGGHSLLLFSQ